MNRFFLFSYLFTFSISLLAQKKEVPFDFYFNQTMRFDDVVLIELIHNDTNLIFKTNTEQLDIPFFSHTYFLTEIGEYCLKTMIKSEDFKDSLERKHCFSYSGAEDKIRLEFTCGWDTLSRKPLTVYRNNRVTVHKYTYGNPADLKLKRLWKKPSPNGEKLYLPYEIYNPSDKLLYSNEENGVAFSLEEYSFGRWNYLNCGAMMRLGKPFKPKQHYRIDNGAFVTGCDIPYLKGDEGLLRLKVEYHFHKAEDYKKERISNIKSFYTFKQFENYQFFDDFNLNQK